MQGDISAARQIKKTTEGIMKISELVTLLQQLQKEHGDINCVCHDTDYSRDEDVSPDVVFYDEELNIVRFMP